MAFDCVIGHFICLYCCCLILIIYLLITLQLNIDKQTGSDVTIPNLDDHMWSVS